MLEGVVQAEGRLAGVPARLGHRQRPPVGDDGGQVCETADSELVQGYWKLRLMVGGEFYVRPVRLDPRVREGLSLVVDVYCPEKRPDIEDFFEDWDFDDTIRD